ncbi:MAG: response regulator [Deltaproteobacteria bacterium]|nr:response regulator [Deltaproteobacteria bacterium]
MKATELGPDTLLTSYEVSDLLQVDPSSINNWVKKGGLVAFKTPGGHHRIRVADLVTFIRVHEMALPRELSRVNERRLLVVDDEPRELKAIERMLKPYRDRVEVRTASRGIDALVMVGLFAPDVVLLDVIMPGLNGIEVCRRLRAMDETKRVKVIISTAHLTADVEAQAKDAGAVRCFAKPIKLSLLLQALDIDPQVIGESRSPIDL